MTREPDLALSTEEKIEIYLHSAGVDHPAKTFVATVSNVYHHFEAQCYDDIHLEIHENSGRWQTLLPTIRPLLPTSPRVLDLGTGTGFAASMVLQSYGDCVEQLVCQDLSPDILEVCRARISQLTNKASFIACDVDSLTKQVQPFDLVVTNSVLHHMIDLPTFFRAIQTLVKPGGFYIAGQEPSSSFYEDAQTQRWTRLYRKWRRLRQLASPTSYLRKMRLTAAPVDLIRLTNEELLRLGMIHAPLAPGVIRQLVDIHIPPPSSSLPYWGEPGFNAPTLCSKYLPEFKLHKVITYSHIKEARGRMGSAWRLVDSALARKHPASGANFLMVVQHLSLH